MRGHTQAPRAWPQACWPEYRASPARHGRRFEPAAQQKQRVGPNRSTSFESIEERLRDARRWLDPPNHESEEPHARSEGMVVVDEKELSRLPGVIQTYWAALALIGGDAQAAHRHARLAIDRAAADDHVTRASASANSGLTLWGEGHLEAAHRAYSGCDLSRGSDGQRKAVCKAHGAQDTRSGFRPRCTPAPLGGEREAHGWQRAEDVTVADIPSVSGRCAE